MSKGKKYSFQKDIQDELDDIPPLLLSTVIPRPFAREQYIIYHYLLVSPVQ